LRAWAHAFEGDGKGDQTLLDQSIREAREALAVDPDSVSALHVLAWAQGRALLLLMTADREQAFREAVWATTRAIELDSTDAFGYALRGFGVWQRGQVDRFPEALADVRHAHEMNPNDTFVLRILGALEAATGEPERGIEHLHQAMRLSPRDPRSHVNYVTLAYASFIAKQYVEGVRWASRGLNDRPEMIQAHHNLTVCLVGLGEIDKAKVAFKALQRVAPPEYE
jgi:tetratricopeptide (TPR) repeat protein